MKRSYLSLTLIIFCFLAGCKQPKDNPQINSDEKPPHQAEILSAVQPDDCYICGNPADSLVPYYAKRDSIGIIHWNSQSVNDTGVRVYDDHGKELFEQDSSKTKWNTFGNGYGSVWINGTPNRGITNVTAYYKEKDTVDFDNVKKILCQRCLNKVLSFYNDQIEYGEISRIGTTGYCLIDFQSRELYTLSDPYRGYYIRDYYVTYNICNDKNNEIDLLIFYAPRKRT